MKPLRDDSGLSLTELLVVAVLVSVILAASYLLLVAVTSMTDQLIARADAATEAQAAVDQISLDLRQSQPPAPTTDSTSYGVFEGSPLTNLNEMIVISDSIYTTGSLDYRPERIRYYVATAGGVNSLKRSVYLTTDVVSPFTHFATTPVSDKTIVKVLVNPAGAPIFCYHTTTASAIEVCGTSPYDIKHGFLKLTSAQQTAGSANYNPLVSMAGVQVYVKSTSSAQSATAVSRALVRIRSGEDLDK